MALLALLPGCSGSTDELGFRGADGDSGAPGTRVGGSMNRGVVTDSAREAGFVDVASRPDAKAAARLFYAFVPAEPTAADGSVGDGGAPNAPLVLLFNGGPGSPTSKGLLAYGTGPSTLADGREEPAPNPARWSRFAHLLYIDGRSTGFSYDPGSGTGDCATPPTPEGDAADHLQVLFAFLAAHPGFAAVPVVLAGESYGGARAQLMMDELANPESYASVLGRPFVDRARAAVRGGLRVRAQVLIQPHILGAAQDHKQREMVDPPPVGKDPYDITKARGWASEVGWAAERALATPKGFRDLVGLPPEAVPRLAGTSRGMAHRAGLSRPGEAGDPPSRRALDTALRIALGEPSKNDAFYVDLTDTACPRDPAYLDESHPFGVGNAFLRNLTRAPLFVTDAARDTVVHTPALFEVLSRAQVKVDVLGEPTGVRSGAFRLVSAALAPTVIRAPRYAAAGHMVTIAEPEAIASDVREWLRSLALAP